MKKNYYLTLDTETATFPFVGEICCNDRQKKKIAIAKPLIYDIGWVITDRKGNIIKKVSYLVQETFFVPSVFNTAYYKEKRQLYIDKLQKGEIQAKNWYNILDELEADLQGVTISTAYNACFDFKKAIPTTNSYIYHLYRNDFDSWIDEQKEKCEAILYNSCNEDKNPDYLKEFFKLRGQEYPICDLWGIACKKLLNNQSYKKYCLNNKRLTDSGLYFSTSAETAFQYLTRNFDFEEEHTALADAIIEATILTKILKKCGVNAEIEPFPFKALGDTIEFAVKANQRKYSEIVAEFIEKWLLSANKGTAYYKTMENNFEKILNLF